MKKGPDGSSIVPSARQTLLAGATPFRLRDGRARQTWFVPVILLACAGCMDPLPMRIGESRLGATEIDSGGIGIPSGLFVGVIPLTVNELSFQQWFALGLILLVAVSLLVTLLRGSSVSATSGGPVSRRAPREPARSLVSNDLPKPLFWCLQASLTLLAFAWCAHGASGRIASWEFWGGSAPNAWSALLVLVGFGLLLTTLADPALGLAGIVVLIYGWPGSAPLLPGVERVTLLWIACGLFTTGTIPRWPDPRSARLWNGTSVLFGAFVTWSVVTVIAAVAEGNSPNQEAVYRIARFGQCALLFAFALGSLSRPRAVAILVGTLVALVATRLVLFPETIRGDEVFSTFAVLTLPFAAVGVITAPTTAMRLATALATSSILISISMTQNRAAALATAAGLLTLVAWTPAPRRLLQTLVVGGLLIVVGGAFLSTEYGSRFTRVWEVGIENSDARERLDLWKVSWQIFRDHPWFGVGLGNYPSAVAKYSDSLGGMHAHNVPLQMLAETGLLGFVLHVGVIASSLLTLWRITRQPNPTWTSRFAGALASSLIAHAVMMLFHPLQTFALAYLALGWSVALSSATGLSALGAPFSRHGKQQADTGGSFSSTGGDPSAFASDIPFAHRQEFETAYPPRSIHYVLLAVGVTVLAVYGSLVPLEMKPISFSDAARQFRDIRYLELGIQSRSDLVANVLLFIPLGFLWSAVFLVDRRWRGWHLGLLVGIWLGCVALSLGIEFTQLWFPRRTVSINDLLAESTGALIGIGVWAALGRRLTNWIRGFTRMTDQGDKKRWLLQAYLLGLVIYSFLPFDVTIRPEELHEKFKLGRVVFLPQVTGTGTPLKYLYDVVVEILIFIPVGMLTSLTYARGSAIRSMAGSIGWGIAMVTAIEFGQLFIFSRYSDATDLVTGTVGISIGALVIHRWLGSTPFATPPARVGLGVDGKWLGAAAAYGLLVALLFWHPWDFQFDVAFIKPRVKEFLRVPFQVLYAGSDTNAMMQLLRKGLWFAPLGVFLSRACRDVTGQMRLALLLLFAGVAGLVAAVVEIGQLFLPDKIFDLTDFLLTWSAAGMGLGVTSRFFSDGRSRADTITRDKIIYVPPSRPEDVRPLPTGDTSNRHEAARRPRHANASFSPRAEALFQGTEIPALFGLRALACLAVFGVHFRQITNLRGSFAGIDLQRLFENGHTGVCLFFLLSGFLLALPAWKHSGRPPGKGWWKSYAWRRTARIAPPYLLCLTLLVLATRHFRGGKDLFDSALHYLFLHNFTEFTFYGINMPFWTLGIQAQFYVLMPLALLFLYAFRHRLRDACILMLFASLLAYFVHVGVMTLAAASAPWNIDPQLLRPDGNVLSRSVVAHLPIFLLGIAAGYPWVRLVSNPGMATARWQLAADLIALACALLTFFLLATPLDRVFEIPHGRYNYPFVPLLLIAILLAAPIGKWSRRLLDHPTLRLLGIISFGVYIYHLPCLKLTARAFTVLGLPPATNWLPFGITAFALSVLVSAVSYHYCEKPLLKCLAERG